MCCPCPRLHIAAAIMINTTVCSVIPRSSHTTVRRDNHSTTETCQRVQRAVCWQDAPTLLVCHRKSVNSFDTLEKKHTWNSNNSKTTSLQVLLAATTANNKNKKDTESLHLSLSMSESICVYGHKLCRQQYANWPDAPANPVDPVAPACPVDPLGPGRPVAPTGPASPMAPAVPFSPWRPASPGSPVRPCGPVSPVFPGVPWSPRWPVPPAAPSKPSQQETVLDNWQCYYKLYCKKLNSLKHLVRTNVAESHN